MVALTGPGGVPPSQLRVSDAERGEVGDVLSQHFADGRLDQLELDERMGKAMGAKTRSDLAGLLVDLPPLGGTPPPVAPAPHHGRLRRLATCVLACWLIVVATSLLAHSLFFHVWFWHPRGLFLLVVVLALVARRAGRRRHLARQVSSGDGGT